jgi:hypothetical protein
MKRISLLMAPLLLGAAPAPGSWPLTPLGWGPAKIGMTRAQVARVLGVPLRGTAIESVDVCVEQSARGSAYAGVIFMFENKRLSRISTDSQSRVRTPSGIRVGDTAAQVRRVWPQAAGRAAQIPRKARRVSDLLDSARQARCPL